MNKNALLALIAAWCLLSAASAKSDEKVSIHEYAWLTGHWVGDGFGGVSEELWSQPKGGVMIGLYRHLKDGENNFYEFITLSETDGVVTLRLKHFNPDMKGWEEKDEFVEFPFVSVKQGKAVFKGLIYELTEPDTLTITLTLKNEERTWNEIFTLERMK